MSPSYDYKCSACKDTATVVKGIQEKEIIPICFKCRQDMTRQFYIGAVTFKGPGYYSTDK